MFLEIKDLKKGFGSGDSRTEVLRGIDFSVEKGEFCVLLGTVWFWKIHTFEYYRWN